MRVGFISTYPPIECGIATYTQALERALTRVAARHSEVYEALAGGSLGAARPVYFLQAESDLEAVL